MITALPLALLLRQLAVVYGCSFIVTNFEASNDRLDEANHYIKFRGPDATSVRSINHWTFLHNLLSMTGSPTLQPFSDNDKSSNIVALFNGEIYN